MSPVHHPMVAAFARPMVTAVFLTVHGSPATGHVLHP